MVALLTPAFSAGESTTKIRRVRRRRNVEWKEIDFDFPAVGAAPRVGFARA
jgi:hypothetical protein